MPREKDFAWAYCDKIPGSIKLLCKFCQDECSGGIFRFKYHLAQILGHDIGPCKKVPVDVKHKANLALECMNEMKAKKTRINAEMSCTQTSSNTLLSPPSYESTLLGPSHIPVSNPFMPPQTQSETPIPPIPTNLSTGGGNVHSFFAPCTQLSAQPSLDGTGWKKNVHIQARKAIANFWYYCDIPFNYARSPYGSP